MPRNAWAVVSATPGDAAGGSLPDAPGNVSIGSVVVDDAPVEGYRGVLITYTAPSPVGTFTGLYADFELPDQSGATQATGLGTVTGLGATQLASKAKDPLAFGPFADSKVNGKVRVMVPEPDADTLPMTCRVTLKSYSPYVKNDSGVSQTFTIPVPSSSKPLSATAYCENATISVPATDSIGQPNPYAESITGVSRIHLIVNQTPPADEKWAGTVYTIRDAKGNKVYTSPAHSEASVELIFNNPASAGTYLVYGPGTDGAHTNPIVQGITPMVSVSIGTDDGTVDPASFILQGLSSEFEFATVAGAKVLRMKTIDFSKATNFSTQFALVGNILKLDSVDASVMRTGRLQVGGGANQVSMVQVWDHAGTGLLAWIGDDTIDAVNNPTGSNYQGAWFKRIAIGGAAPSSAKLIADSAGNLAIDGSVIVSGTLLASNLGAGTLPVGVIYAGTVNVGNLVAGTGSFTGDVVLQRVVSSVVKGKMTLSSSGVSLQDDSGSTLVFSAGTCNFNLGGGGATCVVSSTGIALGSVAGAVSISNGGSVTVSSGYYVGGQQVVTNRQTLPSNDVTGIIAVLRNHGLIT